MSIQITSDLGRCACMGYLVFCDLEIHPTGDDRGDSGSEIRDALLEVSRRVRQRYEDHTLSDIPAVARARKLYHSVGVDPTRTRLSSENLLRSSLGGREIPPVNTLVDTVNLCSLTLLLPFGVYDVHRIRGPVLARLGREGEGYQGLGGRSWVNVEGRPLLADLEGPFGNPTADSSRTSIRSSTSDALITIFAPADYPHGNMEQDLADVAIAVTRFNDGYLDDTGIV